MSLQAEAAPDASPGPSAPEPLSRTRPFYWSVRRELWENHSIWIAPLVVAAVVLFGFTLGLFTHPTLTTVKRTTNFTAQVTTTHGAHITGVAVTPAQRAILAMLPYDFAATAMLVTMLLVAVFYCLGALHNERRDRSILFWKSLPVPDLTTVLAKLIVPMVVLPLVVFVVAMVTQTVMLAMSAAALAAHGKDLGELWTQVPLGSMALVVIYGLVALTLWWAPLYAWLLLVSGWARRAPFLWAVLPPLLLALAEKIAFDAGNVGSVIVDRLFGGLAAAFVFPSKAALKAGTGFPGGLPQIDPGKFFATPDLWIGLVVAAAFVAAAVWLRRYRTPL